MLAPFSLPSVGQHHLQPRDLAPKGTARGPVENHTSSPDGSPSDGVMGCAELSLLLTQYSALLEPRFQAQVVLQTPEGGRRGGKEEQICTHRR